MSGDDQSGAESRLDANAEEGPFTDSPDAATSIAAGFTRGNGWIKGDGNRVCPPGFPIKGNAKSMIFPPAGR